MNNLILVIICSIWFIYIILVEIIGIRGGQKMCNKQSSFNKTSKQKANSQAMIGLAYSKEDFFLKLIDASRGNCFFKSGCSLWSLGCSALAETGGLRSEGSWNIVPLVLNCDSS